MWLALLATRERRDAMRKSFVRITLVLGSLLGACGQTIPAHPVPDNHRPSNAQCLGPAAPGNISCSNNCPTGPNFACTNDSACTGLNARCINGGGPAGSYCTHDACTADADCPSNQTCACHGSPFTYRAGNHCVPGNCRVDADCGLGLYCSPSPASTCSPNGDLCLGYYCHTANDLCLNDSDCAAQPLTACVYSTSAGFWQCSAYGPPL
jgi:hypothetical protein